MPTTRKTGRIVPALIALTLMIRPLSLAVAQQSSPAIPAPPSDRMGRPWPIHDPSTIIRHKEEFWVFSTGVGVASARSRDLVTWKRGPAVFAQPPKWAADVVPGNRGHFWAPDVICHNGRYLLYYSVSAFGRNTSAIGLASTPTLDPDDPHFKWADHGVVIRSTPKDNFNAIDPGVVRGPQETLWLVFGSFWSGIKLIQLDSKTGLRLTADSPIHSLAQNAQIEAAALHWHDGYFYLLVNWGWCCRGVHSTYNIRVGGSREITGPYLDKDGGDLRRGGGSLVVGSEGRFIGPGHPGIVKDGARCLLSYHFYDGEREGRSGLAVRRLEWDEDGWPRVVGPPLTPGTAN